LPDDYALSEDCKNPLFLRIRILELLAESDLLATGLVKILVEIFEYDTMQVHTAIDDARAFGWIDSKSEHEGTSNITYELSHTGKYLIDTLLTDVSVLYMLALDTRLPKIFFENNLIQVHTNHLYERSGYLAAAIVTTLTFLLWLKSKSDNELDLLSTRSADIHYRNLFLNRASMNHIRKELFSFLRSIDGSTEDRQIVLKACRSLLEIIDIA
jgi:hypothetical protein